jgi:hypothetical protein
MRLSNPRNYRSSSPDVLKRVYTCDVDVTTGFLFWKRTVTKQVRRKYAEFWHFSDTGAFTPGYQMEALERACEAATQSSGGVERE